MPFSSLYLLHISEKSDRTFMKILTEIYRSIFGQESSVKFLKSSGTALVDCRSALSECIHCSYYNAANIKNSSGDEIANVNFLYDDIVHVIQNTIDFCMPYIPPQLDAAVMCWNVCLPNSVK